MRVLHLIDRGSGDAGVLMCARACRVAAARHDVVIVGNDAFERRAWALGVESTDRVPPRGRATLGAGDGLARWVRDRARAGVKFDVVQCWSWETLSLAGRCGFEAACVGVVDRAWVEDARRARIDDPLAPHGPVLAAFDHGTAWMLAGRVGGNIERVAANVRVLTPPVFELGTVELAERAARRAALGIDAADVVVQLLADPAGQSDGFRFSFGLGLTHTAGQRVVGLMPRGTSAARRGLRFVLAHHETWRVIEHDEPLNWTLGMADLAVWDQGGGLASIGLATAMGLPVVAINSASVREVLGGLGQLEVVASNTSAGGFVRMMLPFLDHPARRAAAGDALRNAWMRLAGKFEEDLLALWRERVNVPVVREDLPVPSALAGR